MGVKDRRALYHQFDETYDPFVGINANEYLIENYPSMSLRYRRAVWSTIQSDPDFDWEPLWDLIDNVVEQLAETFPPEQSIPVPLDDDNISSDGDSQKISNDVSIECRSEC